MGPLLNFIIENSASITSLTIIIITLLVLLNLFGIQLNKDMPTDLNKIAKSVDEYTVGKACDGL